MAELVVNEVLEEVGEVFEPSRMLEELEAVWSPPPEGLPERVPVANLEVVPELFQPRSMSEKHIEDLRRAIKSSGELDAMLVLPVGQRLIIIDGHHRIEAYKQADVEAPVPVSYFEGSPKEATFEAGRRNSKAKLPMVNSERQNFAWRLVLLGHGSKAEISAASGASTSQVATMRSVKAKLEDDAYAHTSWFRARAVAQGRSMTLNPDEVEQWKEEEAARWADRLAKAFSTKMARNPEIAAMALSNYFGRKLPHLISELRQFVAEVDEDEFPDF